MRLGAPCRRWRPTVSTSRYVPSMPRSATATAFECSACGWRTTKWAGRCGDCEAWGTVAEGRGEDLGRATSRAQLRAAQPATAAVPIGQVDAAAAKAGPTGMSELDRVLGGGLVPGAVVLLAGEPGVGKSTLLLEAGALAAASGRVLYVTGEESAAQVRLRADRIGAVSDSLYLAAETDFGALLGHVAGGRSSAADRRLGADDQRGRGGRRARRRHSGAGDHRGADGAGQAADADHRAGRARHQGRLGSRAAHARAPGRRRAALRRRRARPAADGARAEEQVRPDGRVRLLRARRVRAHWAGRSERAVPVRAARSGAGHLRDRDAGRPAAAGRRGADAGVRGCGRPAAAAGRVRASTRPGSA